MNTLLDLLRQRAASDRLAIVEGSTGSGVTWLDVLDQVERWTDSGLSGPVGLALEDPVAMAANFVAALSAGVIVAPLDPDAPVPDLEAQVSSLGLRAVVTSPTVRPDVSTPRWVAGRHELRLDRAATGETRREPGLPVQPTGVAVIMASSGTTGAPKIVPLREAQLLATAEGVAEALDLSPADRGYSPLPLHHINGLVVGVLSALVAGSTIVVDRRFSRRTFWSTVSARQATWLNLVPAILAIVASLDDPAGVVDRRLIRLARSASAPLSAAVRDRFEARTGIPVVETYGMTEAASQITANPPERVRPGSVGLPVDLEVRVVDSGQRLLAAGQTGRVQIRGPRVTPMYWSHDAGSWSARPATNDDGWLDTADVGYLDPDGYVFLVGRDSEIINRGGEKIRPREVEDVLLADPRIVAAAVVGRSHPTVGEEPVAYVLARPEARVAPDLLARDLTARCETSLSRFKRPAEITIARSLPCGPTGKVRRAELSQMADGLKP